jgi:hypothetical protein
MEITGVRDILIVTTGKEIGEALVTAETTLAEERTKRSIKKRYRKRSGKHKLSYPEAQAAEKA